MYYESKSLFEWTGKLLDSQEAVNLAVKNICDIMRRGNCTSALQYIPELTWIIFMRLFDEQESREQRAAAESGSSFRPSIEAPYRWRDWAAPPQTLPIGETNKRQELHHSPAGSLFDFINNSMLPYLRSLSARTGTTARQKIIGEIVSNVPHVRIDTEKNFLDILDKVHNIFAESVDHTHVFTISQVYEGLLLKMGEKRNDGGQFFTPREVIRAMVKVINPRIGETVYDPGCGTGGFLVQSYEHVCEELIDNTDPNLALTLSENTFYGREKEELIYPVALANLILHGINSPNIWHGNTLTGQEVYGGLFGNAPNNFDVILTNPPFGGKESLEAQNGFRYQTSSTQILFLQHVIDSLSDGGRCGIVLDEGALFRTHENAFVQTKRQLLNDCDLLCIVSLPTGAFAQAGADVKTNLLFFTKGSPTRSLWYYDLSDLKITKRNPLVLSHFDEFFALLPSQSESCRSWSVSRNDIEQRNYDLKAVNPNHISRVDDYTPSELLEMINEKGREITKILDMLQGG